MDGELIRIAFGVFAWLWLAGMVAAYAAIAAMLTGVSYRMYGEPQPIKAALWPIAILAALVITIIMAISVSLAKLYVYGKEGKFK